MERQLKVHLFRTLCFPPKGLKIKLKIRTVNKHFECFDESLNPAATILPHGLFLARPTPESVKDPLLFGVLNHPLLADKEPNTLFGIRLECVAPESLPSQVKEQPLLPVEAQSTPLAGCHPGQPLITGPAFKASVIRSGIEKQFPDSDQFRNFMLDYQKSHPKTKLAVGQSALTLTEPQIFGGFSYPYLIPEPKSQIGASADLKKALHLRPSKRLVSQIQTIVAMHHAAKKPTASQRPNSLPQHPQDNSEAFEELVSNIWNMNTDIKMLLRSLAYFKSFLVPAAGEDLELYRSYVSDCQTELKWLVKVAADLLVSPFLDEKGSFPNIHAAKVFSFAQIHKIFFGKLQTNLQILRHLASKRIDLTPYEDFQITSWEESGDLVPYSVLKMICSCLKNPSNFRDWYVQQVEAKLELYPAELTAWRGSHAEKADTEHQCKFFLREFKGFQGSKIVDNYERIQDSFMKMFCDNKLCMIKSAKSKESTRFGDAFDSKSQNLVAAVFFCHDTTLLLVKD